MSLRIKNNNAVWLGLLVALGLSAGKAAAHSPYLLPNDFTPAGRDHVSVEASFTENFFVPDVAMKADDWNAIGPDGAKIALQPTALTDVTLLEVKLPAKGTYRISSGLRTGRVSQAYRKGDEWEFVAPGETPPEGAVSMQSVTLADTYVSRDEKSDAALAARGSGLELHPLTNPSFLLAGDEVAFELLFDGKPVAAQPIEVHRGGEDYDAPQTIKLTTDASGRVAFKPDRGGAYLLQNRYRVPPATTDGAWRSYTVTVTFEVGRR